MKYPTSDRPSLQQRRLSAPMLVLLYTLVAALWIWLSDRALLWLVGDMAQLAWWQTVKGWLFVAFTAGLLYAERTYVERTVRRAQDDLQHQFDVRGTELERSRSQLQLIMDNAPVLFYLRDIDGRYLMVNQMWERLTGLTRAEVVGKMPGDLFAPARAAELIQAHQEVVRSGDPLTDERRMLWQDREHHFARARFLLTDAAGTPYAVCGILTDITDFRHAELAQRQAEARFRAVFDNANIGIVVVDRKGTILNHNAAYRRIVDRTEEQLQGLRFHDLGHPDDSQTDWQLFQKLADGETTFYRTEKRYYLPDGTEFWMRITGSLLGQEGDEHGRPGLVMRLVEDITPMKQFEIMQRRVQAELERLVAERTDALARANVDLAEAQRVAQVGSWRLEVATGQLTLSGQIYRILDVSPDAFDPTPLGYLNVVHADERGLAEQAYFEIITGKRALDFEHRIVTPAGSTRTVHIRGYVLRDEAGMAVQLFGTLQDVTQRRSMEDELRRLNTQLEARVAERTAHLEQEVAERRRAEEEVQELNRALAKQAANLAEVNRELETFTYSVSHDLKAPLRGIDGYSRLLQEDFTDKLDEDGQRFIRTIRQAAAQMGTLIDDLLTYSRMERRQVSTGAVELAPLLESLLNQLTRGQEQRIDDFELTVEHASIVSDPEGLTLILRNLIENALKFTAQVERPRISVRTQAQGDTCLITVQDNGIGFDMRYHDRIFDIFQRLHRAEDYPGTGVGLAIVRKSAQRMGGRVWAESSPGHGATFYLEIPQ